MELTGKLKEDVVKCETREAAKRKIEEAGIVLSDDELDAVAGGIKAVRFKKLVESGDHARPWE